MHKSAPYRRLLLGSLLFIAVIALLVYGIGWETLKSRREDLIYLGQQHMFLVVCSMLLSLLVGIPSGILLSRPFARRWAEHVMQIFNVGNTLPPLAVLALAMVIIGIGDRRWWRCSSPRCCLSCAIPMPACVRCRRRWSRPPTVLA